jgi:cold-inducible RNA-binding protein
MKNLYVGNLAFSTTEQELRVLFETHGVVERINIVTDKETGRPRDFAFVEMSNTSEADKASAAITGSSLGGRTLKVNEAREKAQ